MVIRLAEQYLIRAEARAQQNKLGEAKTDLDVLRNRAGLPGTTASTQSQILNAVLHERQVELFSEMGHRWIDLKRTGQIDAILSVEKTGWNTNASLYPIQLSQLEANLNLKQNPGY